MLKERLQILVSRDQRRRLRAEAKRRGTSVGSVVREAIDNYLGQATTEDRRRALDGIRALRGRFLNPQELNRLVAEGHRRSAGGRSSP